MWNESKTRRGDLEDDRGGRRERIKKGMEEGQRGSIEEREGGRNDREVVVVMLEVVAAVKNKARKRRSDKKKGKRGTKRKHRGIPNA